MADENLVFNLSLTPLRIGVQVVAVTTGNEDERPSVFLSHSSVDKHFVRC